jgi:hypothetical protein
MTNLDYIKNSWQKYFKFYTKVMFNEEGIPKLTQNSLYPINIHSIAESILCLSELNEFYKNLNLKIEKIIKFAVDKMEFKKGMYCYLVKKLPIFGEYKLKIPMYRWGQAWMFLAIVTYYENLKKVNNEK